MIQKRLPFPRLACVGAVIAALAAAGVSVAGQTGAPAWPDLTGEWQLNPDLSDDPQEALRRMGGGVDTPVAADHQAVMDQAAMEAADAQRRTCAHRSKGPTP